MLLLSDKAIKLVIVGKPDHKNIDVTDYIAENGLTERIIFTDYVSQEDLYLIYAQSYIFCFPSFAEGFGLPPLEAMQCGIPVVVSNTTSLPEVCGEAALYINPDDPNDIAEKLDMLLNDNKLYKEKQEQGFENSVKYSWDKAAANILHIVTNYGS
jgi:glycosyltransferase involved in cell wall biosynthesis